MKYTQWELMSPTPLYSKCSSQAFSNDSCGSHTPVDKLLLSNVMRAYGQKAGWLTDRQCKRSGRNECLFPSVWLASLFASWHLAPSNLCLRNCSLPGQVHLPQKTTRCPDCSLVLVPSRCRTQWPAHFLWGKEFAFIPASPISRCSTHLPQKQDNYWRQTLQP